MKKLLFVFLLAFCSLFAFVACNLKPESEYGNGNEAEQQGAQSVIGSVYSDSSVVKSVGAGSQNASRKDNSSVGVKNSQSAKSVSVAKSSSEKFSESASKSSENNLSKDSADSSYDGQTVVNVEFFAVADCTYKGTDGAVVNGVKTYSTVGKAIKYAETASSGIVKRIKIKPGIYKEKISTSATNLRLIGEARSETKITYGDCSSTAGSTEASATFTVTGVGFSAKNIHFENSFDYLNSSASAKQAVAILVDADKASFVDCKFSGHQDTLEAVHGRQYYKNCSIYGSVDFIFGNNSTCLFENCNVISRNRNDSKGGYIAVTKGNDGTNGKLVPDFGFVFMGCKFSAESGVKNGSVALARPWRANATVSFINCEMGAHISKTAYSGSSSKQRYVHMKGGTDSNGNKIKNEPQNANFTEYGNTGAGAITSAVKGCTMLTKTEAEKYTLSNIFAKTNGMVNYNSEWNTAKEIEDLNF